jgi:hypothetical protein
MTLKTGVVPPTIGYEQLDPACDLDYVPGQARQARITLALSTSLASAAITARLRCAHWRKTDEYPYGARACKAHERIRSVRIGAGGRTGLVRFVRAGAPAPVLPAPAQESAAPVLPPVQQAPQTPEDPGMDFANVTAVTAPMVACFMPRPRPGSRPCQVGSRVKKATCCVFWRP